MAEPMDKDLIDIQPDAWERFERAVDTVSKSGPQHRTSAGESSKQTKTTSQNKGGPATKPNPQR
jgi:hypothetical protein